MVILGSTALQSDNGAQILASAMLLSTKLRSKVDSDSWRVLNVLHRVANQVAALDIGYRAGVTAIKQACPLLPSLFDVYFCSVFISLFSFP